MRDYLGTDIKLTGFDFTVVDGDIDLVSGVDCLKQDLSHAMRTPPFFWGLDSLDFGSRLIEFVQGGSAPFYYSELRQAVNSVFDRESRVLKDSWKIDIYKLPNKVEMECEFLPIEHETTETLKQIISNRS